MLSYGPRRYDDADDDKDGKSTVFLSIIFSSSSITIYKAKSISKIFFIKTNVIETKTSLVKNKNQP